MNNTMNRLIITLASCFVVQFSVAANLPLNFETDLQNKERLNNVINSELKKSDEVLQRQKLIFQNQKKDQDQGLLPADKYKFILNNIIVDTGDEKFFQFDIRPVLQPYMNKLTGKKEIFSLLKDVNNYLAKKGFVTSSATLTPANLKQGILKITIQWGKVENVIINNNPLRSVSEKMLVSQALGNIYGKILNIHDIDQGIENISNYANAARIDIQPSTISGYSVLNISLSPSQMSAWNLSVDNSGPSSSPKGGLYRYNLGYSASNILFGIDTLGIRLNTRYLGHEDNYNYYAGLNYDVPYGSTSLGLQASINNNGKPIRGSYGSYDSKSAGETYSARMTQVLTRNSTDKTSGYVELQRKRVRNYVDGLMTSVNSKPFTDLNIGLQNTTHIAGGGLYSEISYNRGLSIFSGSTGGYDSNSKPLNYQRLVFNAAWSPSFSMYDQQILLSSRLSGQYTKDRLLDSYRFVVGDEYTVRGYKNDGFTSDKGIVLSNTLTIPLMFSNIRMSPFVGIDAAYLNNNGEDFITHAYGAAVGVKNSFSNVDTSLTLGIPLGHSPSSNGLDPYVIYWNVSLSI